MTLKKALLMAVLLTACVLYVLQNSYDWTRDKSASSALLFSDINLEAQRFLIIRNAGQTATIERGPTGGWILLDPLGAPVDSAALTELFGALSTLKSEGSIEPMEQEQDLDAYGLKVPQLELIFEFEGGEHSVAFGHVHPITGRYYAKHSGSDDIHLVDAASFNLLNKRLSDIRDSRPVKFKLQDVKELLVHPEFNSPYQLVLNNGQWSAFTVNRVLGVDQQAVEKAIQALTELRILQFVDIPETALPIYQLNPPQARIVVRLKDATEIELQFGSATQRRSEQAIEKLYYLKLRDEPWVYQLAYPAHRRFLGSVYEFLSREPFQAINRREIERILVKGQIECALERTENDFWNSGDDSIGTEDVIELIESFRELSVVAYPEHIQSMAEQDLGFSNAWLQVRFETQSQAFQLIVGNKVESANLEDSEADNLGGSDQTPRYGRIGIEDSHFAVISSRDLQNIVSSAEEIGCSSLLVESSVAAKEQNMGYVGD